MFKEANIFLQKQPEILKMINFRRQFYKTIQDYEKKNKIKLACVSLNKI